MTQALSVPAVLSGQRQPLVTDPALSLLGASERQHLLQVFDRCVERGGREGDEVEWQGVKASVRDVARAMKDKLVLKRGRSSQGRHVFVGKLLPDREWAAAIEGAGTHGNWLIQEYCPPDRLYAPDDDFAPAEHDAVFGVFGFGHEYAGTFGRLMEETMSGGVVNSARGAKQCIMLEV